MTFTNFKNYPMKKTKDKTSSYIFQILLGVVLLVLFFVRGQEYSIIDYLKLTFGLVMIGLGIYGLIKGKKKDKQSGTE